MKILMGICSAFIFAWLWCALMAYIASETKIDISIDTQILSTAIVVAGALAGIRD